MGDTQLSEIPARQIDTIDPALIFRIWRMHMAYKIKRFFRLSRGVEDITVQEAKELLDQEMLVVLDLRFRENFEKGHIDGSINLEANTVRDNLHVLPKDKTIAVMCWGGGLSKSVTHSLLKSGFDQARNLKGGMDEWAIQIDPSLLDAVW